MLEVRVAYILSGKKRDKIPTKKEANMSNEYHVEAIESAMNAFATSDYEIAQIAGHGAIMSNKNSEKILDSHKKTQDILLTLLQETRETNSLLERILAAQKPW